MEFDGLDTLLAAAGVLVAVGAGVLAYLAWRRPRPPREIVPRFGDWHGAKRIGHQEQSREFLRFLDDNVGARVFINAWIHPFDVPELKPEDDVLATQGFTLRDDSIMSSPNQQISIRVDQVADSQLSYSGGGGWNLKGYFAVAGIVAVREGITQRVIIPIRLEDAAR
jgi:hypothetical protein